MSQSNQYCILQRHIQLVQKKDAKCSYISIFQLITIKCRTDPRWGGMPGNSI